MYQLINNILLDFLYDFKRLSTFRWFATVILGLMTRRHHRGVTSIVDALRLKPELYHLILHFFRSKGYTVQNLYKRWIQTAMKRSKVVHICNRILILGDHIKVPKEGRRMPDIQILHQESENSGKGEFIEGHIYGHVSAVITNGKESRSLPLLTHKHKVPPKDKETKKPLDDTIVVQMMNTVHEAANNIGEPVLSVLDAFFCKSSAFTATEATKTESGKKLVEIIVRASSDTVAYNAPDTSEKRRPGRPKEYGDKVKLYNLFSDMSDFQSATLLLYGKPMKVKYKVMDLIWRPTKSTIRFVAVDSDMGQMVLMSSSLTLTADEIITAYSFRFKIEPGFNDIKNTIGGFSYHFWTEAIPKRKRWEKNSQDKQLDPVDEKIHKAKSAIEAFVCLSTIATGILTIVAFCHNREIWRCYPGWLRTRRTDIPTVAIVKETISQDIHDVLDHSAWLTGFNFIRSYRRSKKFHYADLFDNAV